MAIRYLEKPKGCLRTLKLLHEQREITVRDIMRKTSLSQKGAYSTLNHLANLNLIELLTERVSRGMPKKYKATRKGEEVLFHVSLFLDSLTFTSKKDSVVASIEKPYCTLEILLKAHRQDSVTLTSLVKEEGMCKNSARMGLQTLADLDLLRMKAKRNFRMTKKEYSLTDKGQFVGKALFLVNEKMEALTDLKHAAREMDSVHERNERHARP